MQAGRSENSSTWSAVAWGATAIGVAVYLFLLIGFGATAWIAYYDETQEAEHETRNLALVLEEHAERALRVADVTLRATARGLSLRFGTDLPASSREVDDFLEGQMESIGEILNLFVVGPDGRSRGDALRTAGDFDFSTRPYFSAHRDDPAHGLYISAPLRSNAGRGWVLFVSRRLSGSDGRFAGIVGASISLDYFAGFYRTLAVAEGGAVTLRDRDGIILARQPQIPNLVGQTGPNSTVVDAVRGGRHSGTLSLTDVPGDTGRIVSYRTVEGTPFIVSVSVGNAAVAARWLQGTISYGVVTLVLMVVVAILIWGVTREIGRRTRADQASHQSERSAISARRRLADAIDALPAALLLFDAEERLILANARYTEMFPEMAGHCAPGTRLNDLIRKVGELRLIENTFEGNQDWVDKRLEQHRQGDFDGELKAGDGRWFQSIIRRTSEGGRVCAFIDISESKKTQEALLQAQKMEVVGQLTGGVAHDFNNLLTVILGNAGMLVEDTEGNPNLQGLAQMIEGAALRGAALTQRLLAFARQQPLNPVGVDVNELARGIEDLLDRTIGEDIEIVMALGANLPPALADAAQIEAALLNLVVNSRDAMPDGGRLVIETASVFLDTDYARRERELKAGAYVMLAVTDTGSGMTADVLKRVFEPFFTTKEVGKGSGLGLSMVFGFAKQSGGHLKIYSEAGLGTTVKLYLPEAPVGAVAGLSYPPPDAVPTGKETILVVEDDPDVRAFATMTLRGLGYAVYDAGDAVEALAMLAGPDRVDLLFTDVVLPMGMNGSQLAAEARRRRPGLHVLFASGYTSNAIIHQGRLDEGVQLLSKPYRKADLAREVRKALDR